MAKLRAWDRRDDESTAVFEAFALYREMGPDRSTARVAQELGKSKTITDRWSGAPGGVERAKEWDRFTDTQAQNRVVAEIVEMRRRHAAVASLAIARALQKLQDVDPKDLRATDVAKLLDVGARVEREARGLPGQVVEHREGDPDSLDALEVLSDEQFFRRMAPRAGDAGGAGGGGGGRKARKSAKRGGQGDAP